MSSQDNFDSVFQHGPHAGRSLDELIEEAASLKRLPDGLEVRAMKLNDEWVTLNNRSLYVAQQAGIPHVPVVDVGHKGINELNTKLKDSGLDAPIWHAEPRPCK